MRYVRLGGIDFSNLDPGKMVTRWLSPSERQVDALERLGPMILAATGAATGTSALTNVGAAFGGAAGPLSMLQGGGQIANPYSFSPGDGGAGGPSLGGSGDTTVWIIGGLVLLAGAAIVMTKPR